MDELDLLDWKRRVFAIYAAVRAAPDPELAWHEWRAARDRLFAGHPQSPLESPDGFTGLPYFDYDPAFRVLAEVETADGGQVAIGSSGSEPVLFRHFATARFELDGEACSLGVYWLEGYGGGVFVPFADSTAGKETYGAGRYLLDTVKGADLGEQEGLLVFDFNFAYNPSCSYDPRWACPLAPPQSRLSVAVRAGERH